MHVKYLEAGKEYDALIVGQSRFVQPSHHGVGDQPLVHLVFVKPNPNQQTGLGDLIQWRHDVAHVSHEFSKEDREKANAAGHPLPESYPGGRWKEADGVVPVAHSKPSGEGSPAIQ
jgi:hypothetical protein